MNEEQHTTSAVPSSDQTSLVADLVAAYVSNNSVPPSELPSLIALVHDALTKIVSGKDEQPSSDRREPAVPVKKSVTPDFIISLEDGKKYKSLKRHLSTSYGLSPDQYREKWGLPKDYPMVAPNYAAERSRLAKEIGLGARRTAKTELKVAANKVGQQVKRGRPAKTSKKAA